MSERIHYATASLQGALRRLRHKKQSTLHVQGVENEQDGIGSITSIQQRTSG